LENVLHSSSVISKGKRILSKDLPSTLISEIENKPSSATSDDQEKKDAGKLTEVKEFVKENQIPLPNNQKEESQINFGEKNAPTEQDFSISDAPSSISIEESFDIAYAHARQSTDRNLIETVEKEIIQRALKECGGNQVKASALLGITRATLRKRIDVFEIRY